MVKLRYPKGEQDFEGIRSENIGIIGFMSKYKKLINFFVLFSLFSPVMACSKNDVKFSQEDFQEETPSNNDENKGEITYTPWINTLPSEIEGTTAAEVASSLGVGWNLGNQMDAYSNEISAETAWGNPKATQALFDTLKSRGFSTVRIPVTWLGQIGDAPEYKIDESWLSRVRELVEMAETAGLNAIVNIHHDGGNSKHWLDIKNAALNPEKNEEIKKEIAAVWSQIAESMKDKGNFLMFEAFNEIHDGGWGWGANRTDGGKQYECLNQWNQTFVAAVRSTGGNNSTRWLSVPSYVTNIDLATNGSMTLPKDEAGKVMVSVHFYDPNDFALNSVVTDWGHTGDNSKKGSVVQDEDYMRSQFAKLKTYWVDKGTPVYIGETGPPNQASTRGNAFRNYYLEYLHRAAREANLAVIYWDNGAVGSGTDKFGLFNHSDGEVINNSNEAIDAMVRGGTCSQEGYDLNWIYKNAPEF
ncbi:MAG: glycoside hydrolase family 5 protein [Muribaculaceae bacterium]|nr:glycoside hydrolase family 5 protein [Muribaculaceae bacterium]